MLLTEMGSPGGGTVLGIDSEFQLRFDDLKAKKQGSRIGAQERDSVESTGHVYP